MPLLAGRYAHRSELGRGASGRVILVEDRVGGGLRAAKLVGPAHAERLRWELSSLASVAHPGLARVDELLLLDAAVGAPFRLERGAAVLIEEHVDGEPAHDAIARIEGEPERSRSVALIGAVVSHALAALHAAGLAHCDVKPANIVVPRDPRAAKLVDLELARPIGASDVVSGTPAYLAPEAWQGERSAATDLYALGATLAALLSGEVDTATQELVRGIEAPATRLPGATPPALRRLIGELLERDPAARPADARQVGMRLFAIARSLGAAIDDSAIVAPAASGRERAARVAALPLAGRATELAELIDRLHEPGVIVVQGPRGAGRSRLVREAVRALSLELGRRGARVPTYARVSELGRLDYDAVLHVDERVSIAMARSAVDAAAVAGRTLRVIIETDRDVGSASTPLGPIHEADLAALLADAISAAPVPSLVEAAWRASGGLPGRLCRIVAEAYETGLDPTRPQVLLDLGARAGEPVAVPGVARPLAELLALAGGTLPAALAARLVPDASRAARLLVSLGLADQSASGSITLRADTLRPLCAAIAEETALARALLDAGPPPLAEAFVRAALGEHEAAATGMLRAIREARREGDPERAARIGVAAFAAGVRTIELRLEIADALRAQAREREALEWLAGVEEPSARVAAAELHRLLGEMDAARTLAAPDAAGDSAHALRAQAVLARMSLMTGDMESARVSVPAGAPAAEAARLYEVRALVALADQDQAGARAAALSAEQAARAAGSTAAEARALSARGAAHAMAGELAESGRCYVRAAELAERAGERYLSANSLVNVALSQLELGALGPAIEGLREGARRLVALERRGDAARALYNLGNAAALVGEDELAAESVRRGREWARDDSTRAYLAIVDAELTARAGKLAQAVEALRAADIGPDSVRAVVWARLAVALCARGGFDEAQECLSRAEELVGAQAAENAEIAIARARVALSTGAAEQAAQIAARAQVAVDHGGWEARLRLALVRGEALERCDRRVEAAQEWMRARAIVDEAAASLPPVSRARLRAMPGYQRALATAPVERTGSDARWRAFAAHVRHLVRETRPARLADAIVDAAVDLAGAERGFLIVRELDGELRVLAARGLDGARLASEERPSTSIAVRVMDQARPLVTVDALSDERLDRAASVHAMALRSVLAVPLAPGGGRGAALYLDDRQRPGAFDDATIAVLTDLAQVGSGALQSAERLRGERRDRLRLLRGTRRLQEQLRVQSSELLELRKRAPGPFEGIVAQSEPMRAVLGLVERVSQSTAAVLIEGESGVGKELVAGAIHRASPRAHGPFVSESCAAIPESLLESTLFGHTRGAFTGADRARRGLFELADGGTLFLDEIGETSPRMQAQLLRVIQDGEVRPIGSERSRKVDVRLISATRHDLLSRAAVGDFREDLFYRLAVVRVVVPPLRERLEDLAPLVLEFLARHGPERHVSVDEGAFRALRSYAWPGNARELENEIRRALVLADGRIEAHHLSAEIRSRAEAEPVLEHDLKGQTAALERRLIRSALERSGGNQTRAAALLGLSRFGLQKMMKRLELG